MTAGFSQSYFFSSIVFPLFFDSETSASEKFITLYTKKAAGTSAAPLREIIENYYQVKGEQSFLQNFLSTLGTESVYMGLALIFGVCAFGEPVLWLLPLIKGLGLGLISGYLYQSMRPDFHPILNHKSHLPSYMEPTVLFGLPAK